MHGATARNPRLPARRSPDPYRDAADGISLTTTLVPEGLGRVAEDRVTSLTAILGAFFSVPAMNVNVLNREAVLDAMDHQSTSRRSASPAMRPDFVRLSREQQMDVINRTFHGDGRDA
jgi:formate C-acetyltransferase